MGSAPVQGIRTNLSPDVLSQCAVCHDISYGYSTMPVHVEYCKTFGNFIVLAAKHHSSSTLGVAAGLFTSQLNTTSSDRVAAGPVNGAYWYYVPAKAIGFASTAEVYLNPVDTSTSSCESRLSWEFGWYAAGRVGCSSASLKDTNWRKMIYICNVSTVSALARSLCIVRALYICESTYSCCM